MTPAKRKRLTMILLLIAGVGLAVFLALKAFQQNMLYFYSPTQVTEGEVPEGSRFRLGGLVVDGSVVKATTELKAEFDLTDTKNTLSVVYRGILPDLFREGQGIVAHGRINESGIFVADEVLAKHDENYMSPDVAKALEAAGHPLDKSLVEE